MADNCRHCGHQLPNAVGPALYCTHCGEPVESQAARRERLRQQELRRGAAIMEGTVEGERLNATLSEPLPTAPTPLLKHLHEEVEVCALRVRKITKAQKTVRLRKEPGYTSELTILERQKSACQARRVAYEDLVNLINKGEVKWSE